MIESNLNNLAETLAKSGLASSTTEAMRMAKNIMGTEKKVGRDFDDKAGQIDKELTEKKSYKDEIDDLIQKTSPEKKDFHYMVSGYNRPTKQEAVLNELEEGHEDVRVSDTKIKVEPAANVVDEIQQINRELRQEPEQSEPVSAEPEPAEEQLQEADKEGNVDLAAEDKIPEPVPEHVSPAKDLAPEPEPVSKNKAISDALKAAKPVYTDSVTDERLLKELMDEHAKEVYSNSEPPQSKSADQVVEQQEQEEAKDVPEYTVFNFNAEQPLSNSPPSEPRPEADEHKPAVESALQAAEPQPAAQLSNQPEESSDDFILPQEEEAAAPAAEEPKSEEPERKKEFANPIPKVNLMDHFNFG